MTERELATALKTRTDEEFIAHWMALLEMTEELGFEALVVDLGIEGDRADRQLEVWQILVPHMRAGARTWNAVHDALTAEEHDRVEALLKEI